MAVDLHICLILNLKLYILDTVYSCRYSEQHLAAQRYHRNHAYIAELFQEGSVPDVRTVVTKQRMLILQKQVMSYPFLGENEIYIYGI